MKKPKPPCGRVCPKRVLGCRSTCEKWQIYEDEMAVYRAEQKKEYDLKEQYSRYREDNYRKNMKARGEKAK